MWRKPTGPRPGAKMDKFFSLCEVAAPVAAELDTEHLVRLVIENASRLLDADRGTLLLVDRERQELWSLVAQGLGMYEIRMPLHAGIAGHVAVTGETRNVPDAYADPHFNQAVDQQTGYRTGTLLCMPVKDARGQILGVVQVLNKRMGTFTAEDEQQLARLCSQVAILIGAMALSNSRP